ncbi:hypothetical protein [Streptomyces sp. enrichment culture]
MRDGVLHREHLVLSRESSPS